MSTNNNLDEELLGYISLVLSVCSSRAKFVIEKILENGSISSEEIKQAGYMHGARAVGDVRDNGIPLITSNIKGSDGRTIAKYTFGDAKDIKRNKFGGRVNFPASLKPQLIERDGLKCSISNQELPNDQLQIDHRVPYYISGDINGQRDTNDFMLLSKSMQRAKSWDCENCENLLVSFDVEICKTCYWASPEDYKHVAMKEIVTVSLTWDKNDMDVYRRMDDFSKNNGKTVQNTIKEIIAECFSKDN